jgi:hypothetical protein
LFFASLCIGIAAVIDFLTVFVARQMKALEEKLGKQLDFFRHSKFWRGPFTDFIPVPAPEFYSTGRCISAWE